MSMPGGNVLSIVMLDIRRIFMSKATWFLLLIALAVMAFQTVQFADEVSASLSVPTLDVSGYQTFEPPSQTPPSMPDMVAREASPQLRLMLSFQYLDYLALAAIVVFGGFFAQDIVNDYVALRRCRGLSARRQFVANLITIVAVSFAFTVVGIAFLGGVCWVVNPNSVNSLTNGLQALEYVQFLPQEAAAQPIGYVAWFALLYTAVLSFLGMLGYFAAKVSRRVLVAALAPAAVILLFGRLAPALPWIFEAFDYENLSFAQRGIIDLDVAFRFAGVYPVWIGIFAGLGFLSPVFATSTRKVRAWLMR
jgi:hypothetical protein